MKYRWLLAAFALAVLVSAASLGAFMLVSQDATADKLPCDPPVTGAVRCD